MSKPLSTNPWRGNDPLPVGRRGVNLERLEGLALPEPARRKVDLIVIDEIGKMECSSGRLQIDIYSHAVIRSALTFPLFFGTCFVTGG
ncbi:MAG: hypothetical protein DMG31_17590 [Acidobacteria bacterium]|nr:MAG: hypothetical protein DMG31_17590 [Acidobacteriota bacterium]